MISFPDQLPLPMLGDFEIKPVSNIMSTGLASGRNVQRQTFDVVPATTELTWLFTDQESQFFAYWAARIARADWFTMKLRTPIGLGDLVVRFTPDGIKGPKRFGLDKWTYTAEIEIRENPILEPDWVALLPGVFPVELPLPTRREYAFEPVNNITSTGMENGRGMQRESFEVVPTFIELTWLFNDKQSQLFAYWAARLARADWFSMKLRTPLGYDHLTVRFTDRGIQGPKRFALTQWTYTAKVEIRENPLLPAGWVELLPDYILLSDIFDHVVNEDWPEA